MLMCARARVGSGWYRSKAPLSAESLSNGRILRSVSDSRRIEKPDNRMEIDQSCAIEGHRSGGRPQLGVNGS